MLRCYAVMMLRCYAVKMLRCYDVRCHDVTMLRCYDVTLLVHLLVHQDKTTRYIEGAYFKLNL